MPFGVISRLRVAYYRLFGMNIGSRNRLEAGRIRRLNRITLGNYNAFTQGWFLWPLDDDRYEARIVIGDHNYFNRNAMIDACQSVQIGSFNMFGPDVYITDSNHSFGLGTDPHQGGMQRGNVKIGNYCWIGAKAIILKDVELGDYCVVAAGAVVTKSFPDGSVIGGVPAKLLR